jgi:hypothetical protein
VRDLSHADVGIGQGSPWLPRCRRPSVSPFRVHPPTRYVKCRPISVNILREPSFVRALKIANRPSYEGDILRIGDDLLPEIEPKLDRLLRQGRTERVQILEGTEGANDIPRSCYARTKVKITFNNERDLRQCVRLLRWSDQRLLGRPDQRILWDWERIFKEGITISFGVNWYNKEFFDARKDAIRDQEHQDYFSIFGASANDFEVTHEITEAASF